MRLLQGRLEINADIANPTGIAVGVSFLIATGVLGAFHPAVQKEVGDIARYLWIFILVTFNVGLFIGWAEGRNRK